MSSTFKFTLLFALLPFLNSCTKDTPVIIQEAISADLVASVGSYNVHATIRKLDQIKDRRYNYEISFWVTTSADSTNALRLPGALQVSYLLISGNNTYEKTIPLQKGTYITRQILALKTPATIIGRFTAPDNYMGKPINWKDTITETTYNLLPVHVQGTGFVDAHNNKFIPWGVNYTNTNQLRLIDDDWYNDSTWEIIKQDFREMKALDLNVIRIHLQYNRFMINAATPNQQALNRLRELIEFAGIYGLYLDITGLCCYIKEDTPAWYDGLNESDRWATQAVFWKAIAKTAGKYNNVFVYNLMNEPVTPSKNVDIWLPGDSYGGYYFVQYLTQKPAGRSWETVTRSWIQTLKAAIREEDTRTPVTVGFIGLGVIAKFNDLLDYNSAHVYPEEDNMQASMTFVEDNQSDKPLVIEETNWFAGFDNMSRFMKTTQDQNLTAGFLSHYHGETIAELEKKTDLGSAIQKEWYELFAYELNPNHYKP